MEDVILKYKEVKPLLKYLDYKKNLAEVISYIAEVTVEVKKSRPEPELLSNWLLLIIALGIRNEFSAITSFNDEENIEEIKGQLAKYFNYKYTGWQDAAIEWEEQVNG